MSKRHFHTPGSDFVQCGRCGPKIQHSSNPEDVNCLQCLSSLRKGPDGWEQRCQFTSKCSGCACECGENCGHSGDGCRECGHSGVRRNDLWLPVSP